MGSNMKSKANKIPFKVPVKEFVEIVKDSAGILYGGARDGSLWRLDKLDKKGIPYKVIGHG